MNLKLEEKNKKFFNKFASSYDVKIFKKWQENIRKKIIEEAGIKGKQKTGNFLTNSPKRGRIEEAEIKNNSKILDAGCGTGEFLKLLLLEKKNLKLYGIDVSDEMLKIAGKKLGKKANLKLFSVEKANFKNNYFDYVFSEDAFHHYADYDLVMKNFYRVLRKGGKLIIADFNFGAILNKVFHWLEPGNNKMHSKKQFIELFKKYKFKKIKQKKINLIQVLTIGIK